MDPHMLVLYNGYAFHLQVHLDQNNEEAGPKVGESFSKLITKL
jgi:hypothetical protein